MSTDLQTIEQQEEAELKERQRVRREEATRKAAEEEAARKAAEPKLLPRTKTEGAVIATSTIETENEASFVVCNEGPGPLFSRVSIKHVVPRTSAEEAAELRALLDADGSIRDAAQAAYLDVVASAWHLKLDSKAFHGLTFYPLCKALSSVQSKKGTMAGKSYAKLLPIAKILRKRQAKTP